MPDLPPGGPLVAKGGCWASRDGRDNDGYGCHLPFGRNTLLLCDHHYDAIVPKKEAPT